MRCPILGLFIKRSEQGHMVAFGKPGLGVMRIITS